LSPIGTLTRGPNVTSGTVIVQPVIFIDPTAKVTVGNESESKSRNNPYLGLELNGQIVHTMFEGTFTVKNNHIQEIHND
jgi:dihydroorotase-like cyclic amidohydrolase